MSEYLSKEEIKQWRSSLEKITLEEFAARLGKKVESEKPTNDLIDIVLKGKSVVTDESEYKSSHIERLSAIAERALEREQQIAPTPFSIHRFTQEVKEPAKETINSKNSIKSKISEETVKKGTAKTAKSNKSAQQAKSVKTNKVEKTKKTTRKTKIEKSISEIVFKKALTDREQKVFDYFAKNKGNIVYAKDLAQLLELPRDYVYKYIKNLRAKIDGERLSNADKGGFILNI